VPRLSAAQIDAAVFTQAAVGAELHASSSGQNFGQRSTGGFFNLGADTTVSRSCGGLVWVWVWEKAGRQADADAASKVSAAVQPREEVVFMVMVLTNKALAGIPASV
jgi:hypothetical protein